MSTIGEQARQIARKKILVECKKAKLTSARVLKRISEALDACETKTSYDKDRGKWQYSKPLIDHGKRLDAAALAAAILDLKPVETKNVNLGGSVIVLKPDSIKKPKNSGLSK